MNIRIAKKILLQREDKFGFTRNNYLLRKSFYRLTKTYDPKYIGLILERRKLQRRSHKKLIKLRIKELTRKIKKYEKN